MSFFSKKTLFPKTAYFLPILNLFWKFAKKRHIHSKTFSKSTILQQVYHLWWFWKKFEFSSAENLLSKFSSENFETSYFERILSSERKFLPPFYRDYSKKNCRLVSGYLNETRIGVFLYRSLFLLGKITSPLSGLKSQKRWKSPHLEAIHQRILSKCKNCGSSSSQPLQRRIDWLYLRKFWWRYANTPVVRATGFRGESFKIYQQWWKRIRNLKK